MRFHASYFRVGSRGGLVEVMNSPLDDVEHAHNICNQLHEHHGDHYLVAVVDMTTMKVFHTYSTADWIRRRR